MVENWFVNKLDELFEVSLELFTSIDYIYITLIFKEDYYPHLYVFQTF